MANAATAAAAIPLVAAGPVLVFVLLFFLLLSLLLVRFSGRRSVGRRLDRGDSDPEGRANAFSGKDLLSVGSKSSSSCSHDEESSLLNAVSLI